MTEPRHFSGMTTAQRRERASLDATTDMAQDALASLPFGVLCVSTLAHYSARPDIEPEVLHDLANQLGRLADLRERENR